MPLLSHTAIPEILTQWQRHGIHYSSSESLQDYLDIFCDASFSQYLSELRRLAKDKQITDELSLNNAYLSIVAGEPGWQETVLRSVVVPRLARMLDLGGDVRKEWDDWQKPPLSLRFRPAHVRMLA